MKILITLYLSIFAVTAMAQSKQILTSVDSVDVPSKTIEIDGVTYEYSMLDEEDSFHEGDNKAKNLKYISKYKKYYVTIDFDSYKAKHQSNYKGTVIYIGVNKNAF